jgi:hypothetical protein
MVFLNRDKVSGTLFLNVPYMDKYEISDECIAMVEPLADKDKRYNVYDRSEVVVHGIVIGSTRLPGGGHHHGHMHDHHPDHSHADEEKDRLCSMLGEIPRVWPNCEHDSEGVLIDVKQVLKGSAGDTVKIAVQRVYAGAYPQFEEEQEVIVFLAPLERDFYRLVGHSRSKVLLKDGKVAGKETPQEFIERIAAKGD